MNNLVLHVTKLQKDYNFILNYPIEVARKKTSFLKDAFQTSISKV